MPQAAKVLVVYYSRSGNTRQVAKELARQASADLLEVTSGRYSQGTRGYLRAVLDASLGRRVPFEARAVDFSRYDAIVVGSPIWNASVSAPIRAFMMKQGSRLKSVAFFATYGGTGAGRVFRQLRGLSPRPPIATLALTEAELKHGLQHPLVDTKIGKFIQALRGTSRRRAA